MSTSATTSRTSTGSLMAPTFAPLAASGHLRVGNWLSSTAGFYRVSVATCKGWMYGPRSVWNVAKTALTQMVNHGERSLADEKMTELELAFVQVPQQSLKELLKAKAIADAEEDVQRAIYCLDPNTNEHRALRRKTLTELTLSQQVLRALDAAREVH